MNIPDKERWFHTPEMKAKMARADAWMRVNPPRETDLAELRRKLESAPHTRALMINLIVFGLIGGGLCGVVFWLAHNTNTYNRRQRERQNALKSSKTTES